jgi:hypothetical protein
MGFMTTCVPRAPRAWPHLAQKRPVPASAPQRGHVATSGMGVVAGWPGGGFAAEGRRIAGTTRAAGPAPGFW